MIQNRPGDAAVSANEDIAITEINKAIGAIKHAAIDDGKNIDEHPSADLPAHYRGRLHEALDLLNKVHSDVAREEDDPQSRELRDRAVSCTSMRRSTRPKAPSWRPNNTADALGSPAPPDPRASAARPRSPFPLMRGSNTRA
jgi:hypothetical protein